MTERRENKGCREMEKKIKETRSQFTIDKREKISPKQKRFYHGSRDLECHFG